MSATSVKRVTPFEFRRDFEAPETETGDGASKVTLGVDELAALLDDARRGAAELVRDEQIQLQADAMQESADALKSALGQILDLVEALEKSALSPAAKEDALSGVRHIAAELIDGQGNLFQS